MVRFLLVLTVLFVVLLSLAPVAVGSQSYGSAVPAAEADSVAADFIAALDLDVARLDAALAEDRTSFLVTSQIYDTLVAYQPGGSFLVPGLAQNWSVSGDGLTWTFNLRPGISFHDGTALNADAVAFNIRRWWDRDNPYHNGNFPYFSAVLWWLPRRPGLPDHGCERRRHHAGADHLGRAELRSPEPAGVPRLRHRQPVGDPGGDAGGQSCGHRAVYFVERVSGDHIRLAANAAYWGGTPHLAGLVFRVISDATARFAALKSGAVQSAEGYAPGAATDPDLHPMSRPSVNIGYLGINRGHDPLGNPLVQQAIAHAINRPALIASHYGGGAVVAHQFLPDVIWGYDPGLADYSYDPVLAKSLLAQAGFPDGFTTTLAYANVPRPYLPDPGGTASAVQADLEAVGIHAQLDLELWTDYLANIAAGNVDLFLLGWVSEYLHPVNFFRPVFCGSRANGFGPLDDLLCSEMGAA